MQAACACMQWQIAWHVATLTHCVSAKVSGQNAVQAARYARVCLAPSAFHTWAEVVWGTNGCACQLTCAAQHARNAKVTKLDDTLLGNEHIL